MSKQVCWTWEDPKHGTRPLPGEHEPSGERVVVWRSQGIRGYAAHVCKRCGVVYAEGAWGNE